MGLVTHIWQITGQSKEDLGPMGTIISGGVAGTTLWAIIFPADVIKSRQQVRNKSDAYNCGIESLL